jgi:hypothetical protein
MKPPGTPHHWRGILLLTALAIGLGLAYAADAQTPAAGTMVGEVLPMQPPKQAPITEIDRIPSDLVVDQWVSNVESSSPRDFL